MEDLDKGDDIFWLSFLGVNMPCKGAWHKWSFQSSILRALRSPTSIRGTFTRGHEFLLFIVVDRGP